MTVYSSRILKTCIILTLRNLVMVENFNYLDLQKKIMAGNKRLYTLQSALFSCLPIIQKVSKIGEFHMKIIYKKAIGNLTGFMPKILLTIIFKQ